MARPTSGVPAPDPAGGVRLRPLRAEDLPRIAAWLADRDVRRAFLGSGGASPRVRRPAFAWGVARRTPGGREALVGWVELADLDPEGRSAELRICLGEKGLWGRGYGSEAVRLVLRRAFGELGLDEVYLRVAPDNRRAIRAYRKCGFAVEGLFRAGRHASLGLRDHLLMTVRRPARGARPEDAQVADGRP